MQSFAVNAVPTSTLGPALAKKKTGHEHQATEEPIDRQTSAAFAQFNAHTSKGRRIFTRNDAPQALAALSGPTGGAVRVEPCRSLIYG